MKRIKVLSVICLLLIHFLNYAMDNLSTSGFTFFESETVWTYQHAYTMLMVQNNDIANPLATLLLIIPHKQPLRQKLWTVIGQLSAKTDQLGCYDKQSYEYMSKITEHVLFELIDHGNAEVLVHYNIHTLLTRLTFKSITIERKGIPNSPLCRILFKKNDAHSSSTQ